MFEVTVGRFVFLSNGIEIFSCRPPLKSMTSSSAAIASFAFQKNTNAIPYYTERGNSDVRVQDKEEAILILGKLHTTLDSPFPLFFLNRVTSFTSPKSENTRKISSSVKARGMSPTNNLFPGIVTRLDTLDDELLLPDLDFVSGDFEERSSCLLSGSRYRRVALPSCTVR